MEIRSCTKTSRDLGCNAIQRPAVAFKVLNCSTRPADGRAATAFCAFPKFHVIHANMYYMYAICVSQGISPNPQAPEASSEASVSCCRSSYTSVILTYQQSPLRLRFACAFREVYLLAILYVAKEHCSRAFARTTSLLQHLASAKATVRSASA